ncbi:MAG: hypothetical protein J0L70_31535 [Leptolyngbya sp. UWPOB_LEPTO1]|uniref:hypothetical protein n=1 Tax=Leptolyngbya sp. UWPOB_LEPTO1 TaxID=2815653 RepID=UPI001AD52A95|nr:hypothetical protein [Leptolyngbya sp. UWPOB_LEPTO1]MBN8565045.1 hypothetical protein [Leptolyngbya sp. UWPOB_LEPTO1]
MKLFLTLSLVGTTLLSHFSQAFRLHPVVIAGLTTGMILTCSMTIAQSVTTGWLFNGQSTLNQITLNGIKYTGECAAGPFFPELTGTFISQKTPPAPHTRVLIKNVTLGVATDPNPYTNREYDERRPTSEIAKMDFSRKHRMRRFGVVQGLNTFEYTIKRRDKVLETGTFTSNITTSVREEERNATWIRDKVCANRSVSLDVCADVRSRRARQCQDGRVLESELTPDDPEITSRIYNDTGETLTFRYDNREYRLSPGEYTTLRSFETPFSESLYFNTTCKNCRRFSSSSSFTPGKRYRFTANKHGETRTIQLEDYPRSNY